MELHELLNKIDLAVTEMAKLTRAATDLVRSQSASLADDDQWTRLPSGDKGVKCAVSGVSRGAINRLIGLGTVRRKTSGRMVFYSAADWRKHLAEA